MAELGEPLLGGLAGGVDGDDAPSAAAAPSPAEKFLLRLAKVELPES